MKKYTDKDIQDAKRLRITGRYSFQRLRDITGIPLTTLKNWCRDDGVFTPSQNYRLQLGLIGIYEHFPQMLQ